jgi:chromosome partitioning protein
MAVKIAVANQKGGVGKTTTAICLAQELRRREYRVLLIDSDAQCNSTSFYEAKIDDQETLLDIFCGDEPGSNCVQHTSKGDIIASDPQLKDAETMVKVDERRFSHLKRSCKELEDQYDYIVIDTPPAIGVALKNVLAYVDYIVIPVEESGWSMAGLMDFAKAIDMARDNNEKLKVAGILIVKTKPNTKKSGRMQELAETLGAALATKTFSTKIRESSACAEALTEYCVPLHEYAPHATTTRDYDSFIDELLEVI